MAASSSVNAARALAGLAVSSHGSPSAAAHADRLALPAVGFAFSSLSGRSLASSLRFLRQAQPAARRTAPIRADAVQTLEATATEALVEKSINTIRFLSIDAVEKANSGHPGLPMGCAPMGHILYDEVMRYNPKNPYWFNRDRFVLSAGHGCMLQYSLLHLSGYDSVQTEDLQQFRQWGSRSPGHPENFETPGIEVTTGPLGQGIGNAVGLALAERHLAARFNKPDNEIVDHYTYVILGDGCQMEGISNEACSLAGHWGLGKLIAFYDDNHISIDGDTEIAFTEDVSARFEALGWHTIWVKNGNTDYDEIRAAIKEAKAVTDKPTLIKVTTTIGYGSPNKANSYSVHGSALGAKEVDATRQNLGWPYEPFHVPEDVKNHWSRHVPEGATFEAEWNAKFAEYEKKYQVDAAELKSIISGELPAGWEKALPTYTTESPADATRNLSQQNLNALAKVLPGLLGGSADLASSNMTLLKMFGDFQKGTPEERNVRFGVREHGMGAICNGIALHSPGLLPYCATFFIFTDYMRAAMRISALCEAGVIYVMTHDSIGLGEDGPTHQPIEHLISFRAMPNILMLRPADGNETAGAYKVAVLNRKRPSIVALSRQKLPHLAGTSIEAVEKGGYIISDNTSGDKPDLILIGTGSELEIAAKAAEVKTEQSKMVVMQCSSFYPKFLASLQTNNTNNPSSTHIARRPLHQLQKQRIMKSDIYEDQESLCLRHSDRLSQVRRMFDDQTRGDKETLLFIDSLQKLAIDYHFEEEIQAKMHSLYDQRLTISNGEASSIAEAALLFRLLRQSRYPVSTDVLHRFHDGRGNFMASLSKEMHGLMNLFEASSLNTGGELILYRANEFSSHHLRSYMASLGPEFAMAIEQVLEAPSHMTLQRFKARQYLDSDNSYHNLHVRELGKMDFNMLQSLHQKELKEVTSWWKKSELGQELGFARDQSLKWYTWTMTSLPSPKYSYHRIVLSKIIAFVYLLDDIFDVEGSIDDLHLFVQAIQRWDQSSMDSLPNYMRACFKALNSTINEIAEIVLKEHGWNPIEYLKKSWIQLSNAFLVEAKWLSKDQVPTMDDYMKIATITCGVPAALMHMYFLLGHRAKANLCEDLPSLISCPARILRLWDDLGSAKDEKQNGRDGSLLACMMKENPHWSLEVAKEKVMQMIDEAWEELNKECFSSSNSTVSQDFVRACLNSARMVRVMYNYNEEHNLPMLKEYINLLLFKQI